jgi:hypothetical protein
MAADSGFAQSEVSAHTGIRDDDSEDELEGLMAIPRDKLVAMVAQVAEMYQGWDQTQLFLAKLGKQLDLVQAEQERQNDRMARTSDRVARLETVLPVSDSDRAPAPSKPSTRTLSSILEDYEWEDSPTKTHRVVRVPKRDLEVRKALRVIADERDARKWRRATGFVSDVVRAQSKKLIGRAITIVITAAAVYMLHQMGLLGRPVLSSAAPPEPVPHVSP